MNTQKLKQTGLKILNFILNPHLLMCFGLAWIITNGWSYLLLGIGTYFKIPWMITVAGAYLSFLWLPGTPEKIATVAIALFLLKKLFPSDTKTLAELRRLSEKLRLKRKKSKPTEDK